MLVLSHQSLKKHIRGSAPTIIGDEPILDEQIQPASVDLTIGKHVFGMRTSALPREGQEVEDLIKGASKYSFDLLREEDKLLIRGQTYLVPLNERLVLPEGFSAKFSPKSSIGRIDVLVRIVAHGIPRFDHVPEGYKGKLYLEITPLSWDILVREGQPFVQMRIRTPGLSITESDVINMHVDRGILWDKDGKPLPAHALKTHGSGLYLHVDLDREVVGFVARDPVLQELALSKKDHYDPEDFWEPIIRPKTGSIILNPKGFYLLATKERIKIPPDLCGDLAPYDASAGEFRTHYAGFFDPGFGGTEKESTGSVGVMEIRGRELPFKLEDNQPVCRMDFERLDETPDVLYGVTSHYTRSGASLGKFFKRRFEIWEE